MHGANNFVNGLLSQQFIDIIENFPDDKHHAYWQGEKSQNWAIWEGGDLRLAEAQKNYGQKKCCQCYTSNSDCIFI